MIELEIAKLVYILFVLPLYMFFVGWWAYRRGRRDEARLRNDELDDLLAKVTPENLHGVISD